MRRNVRVIKISGIKGIFFVVFAVSCLAAGFIAFPAIVAMQVWNYISAHTSFLPVINIYQGLLLWAIVAIVGFLMKDEKNSLVAFKTKDQLSKDELDAVMRRIKLHSQAQAINSLLMEKTAEKKENVEDEKEKV